MYLSPHDPRTVYQASHVLHRSTDEGVTWEIISHDLTAYEPDKQVTPGSPITRDITGEEVYSSIYSMVESRLEKGVLWVGANDGPVHVSRDGGKTWKKVTPPNLPPGGRVQTIEDSPHRKGSAYIAVYRFLREHDLQPYIYATTDYGATWARLTDGRNGIPADHPTRVGREARRGVPVIDDAAYALGTFVGRKPVGAIADMTCFSFYATKNLTTGEGGMVTMTDRRLAERVRRLSLHGLTRDASKRYSRSGSWKYDVVELGYKYNMTDVAAGIGLAQFAKFRWMQARRRKLALRYTRLLSGEEAFETPSEVRGTTHAWHVYILGLNPGVLRIGGDELIDQLRERGIGSSVHFCQ